MKVVNWVGVIFAIFFIGGLGLVIHACYGAKAAEITVGVSMMVWAILTAAS